MRRNPIRLILAIWLAAGALLITATWWLGLDNLAGARRAFLEQVADEQQRLAGRQAERVGTFIRSADQLLVLLRDERERGGDAFRLESFATAMLQGYSARLMIIDASGRVLLNSRRARNTPPLLDYQPFLAHQRSPYRGFRIFEQLPDRSLRDQPIMAISRRIDATGGAFDGMVVIEFLASELMANAALPPGAALTLQMIDGVDAFAGGDRHELLELREAGIAPASFGYTGKQALPGSRFSDGAERIIGWSTVDGAPMLVAASMNQQTALSSHRQQQLGRYGVLAGCTLFWLVAVASGGWWHLRRDRRRQRIRQVHAAFRQAVEGTHDVLYMVRPVRSTQTDSVEFIVEDCNEQAARRAGLDRQWMLGRSLRDLMVDADFARIHAFMLRVLAEGMVDEEIEIAKTEELKPGQFRGGWVHRRGVRTEGGLAITVRDITESREQQATLATMAVTDALTGLPNRRWLIEQLPGIIARAAHNRKLAALLFIDLDNFKAVNDTLGHEAGDNVLKDISACLRATVRSTDTVVRLGGDEFTVVLEDIDQLEDGEVRAARVVSAINRLNGSKSWGAFAVTASVGIAAAPMHAADAASLLQYADIAMYAAKSAGKARFRSFEPDFAVGLQQRVRLQQDLAQAIGTDQLLLHFQPRIDAFSGELTAVESLLRWQHPTRGLLSPQEFVPLAEERGLIVPLGEWALELLCRQVRAWDDAGLERCGVALNVSELQLRSERFRLQLISRLANYRLPMSRFALELTESALGQDGSRLASEIRQLRDLSVRIEIDDFGTGMSSLSRLQQLQVDVLKIDKSFVQGLGLDQRSDALCHAVLSIGRSLGIRVVAEGVETPDQLEKLRQFGCDEVQGYLIARPLPATEIEPLVRRRCLIEPAERTLLRFGRSS